MQAVVDSEKLARGKASVNILEIGSRNWVLWSGMSWDASAAGDQFSTTIEL